MARPASKPIPLAELMAKYSKGKPAKKRAGDALAEFKVRAKGK